MCLLLRINVTDLPDLHVPTVIAELSKVSRLLSFLNDFLGFVAKSIKQNKLFFQTFYLLSHQNQSLGRRSQLCVSLTPALAPTSSPVLRLLRSTEVCTSDLCWEEVFSY